MCENDLDWSCGIEYLSLHSIVIVESLVTVIPPTSWLSTGVYYNSKAVTCHLCVAELQNSYCVEKVKYSSEVYSLKYINISMFIHIINCMYIYCLGSL